MSNQGVQDLSVTVLADRSTPKQPVSPDEAATPLADQESANVNLSSPISPPFVPLIKPPLSMIQVWTPQTIAVAIVLGGYPAGSIMAAMNWYRLGLRQKAHLHLVGSLWTVLGLGFLGLWWTESPVYLLGFIMMVSMARALFVQMENDIAEYRTDERQVIEASGCLGVLLGLGIGLLYLFSLSLLFTFVPLLIIGAVLFLITVIVLLVPVGEPLFSTDDITD